jgi:hypothetical protein
MEKIEQPKRKLPKNTIMFCEKPWQIPSLILAMLIALTFAWGFYIVSSYDESEFYEDVYDLSVPEFMFRDMANSGLSIIADGIAPSVVGIGANGANMPTVASGAIVSANGHVISVLHPLKNINEISTHVRTPTGIRRYRAEIVKTLPSHNLALLKILTPDRFLFFPVADTTGLQVGNLVLGVGFGLAGKLISKEGQILHMNSTLGVGAMQMSNLLGTDAVYSWEQNGGPIVSRFGELVGISMSVVGEAGAVGGYAVPAHVILSHFADVVSFKKAPRRDGPQALNAAMPAANTGVPGGTLAPPASALLPSGGGSAAWWAMAKAQMTQENSSLGMNVAAPIAGGQATPAPRLATTSPGLVDNEHIGRTRIAGYLIGDIVGLALLAVVVGITSGMMTMGGGILQVAGMMIFFGYGMYLIRPVAYLTNIFIFGAAARRNSRAGLVMWDTVRSVAPWAVVGVVIGYFIGNELGDKSIGVLLGVFAALMTAKGLHEILNDDQEEVLIKSDEGDAVVSEDDEFDEIISSGEDAPTLRLNEIIAEQSGKAILGLPSGLISGILGISGGVAAVPLQRFIGGVAMQNAIANSSVIVFWASLSGAILAFVHGVSAGLIEWQAPLTLAAIMVPGAYLGGIVGAKLMKQLPVITLKWFYTVIMAAVAVRMLFFG